MDIRQIQDFSYGFGNGCVRLPKWALYAHQDGTSIFPARFLYVPDVRTCANYTFDVWAYVPATGDNYKFSVDVRTSSIARAFANFADKLPLSCINAPVWPIYHRDNIGQPHARRTRPFDAKRARKSEQTNVVTDVSVVHNVEIGHRRYAQEGYYKLMLNI